MCYISIEEKITSNERVYTMKTYGPVFDMTFDALESLGAQAPDSAVSRWEIAMEIGDNNSPDDLRFWLRDDPSLTVSHALDILASDGFVTRVDPTLGKGPTKYYSAERVV